MNETLATWRRRNRRWLLWARRHNVGRKLAFSLAAAAAISGIATVAALTGTSPLTTDPRSVIVLLYVDAVLVLLLGAMVVRRLALIWGERRRGLAGSGLHTRLVLLFAAVAVTPAIVVALFSAMFLNYGLQAWFNERVRTAVEGSRAVAQAYLREHQQNIRADALAMAADLNREAGQSTRGPARFAQILSAQAALRDLSEAMVIDAQGRVIARAQFSLSLEQEVVPREALIRAAAGEAVVFTGRLDDRVRALLPLERFTDAYLLIGQFIEPRVINHIEATEQAVAQYKSLEQRGRGLQITFVGIFVVVALMLLLAAAWVGLNLATRLAQPISELIGAAERVRKGDLAVRVPETAESHEIGLLTRAFNRMTDQIDAQQRGLVEANRQLGERTRFTETVLAGVSAGVVGLDATGQVTLPNRSACELLGLERDQFLGRPLADVVPEMAPLIEAAGRRPDRLQQAELKLLRDGRTATFMVRVAAERLAEELIGYVVTFDDITELQSAQRTAAWADVARRIAHEIKNPLTPIQLSAERLKRKYLREIATDPDTFRTCVETIIRQVEDIGRMVDEFSSFARMPQPSLKPENLTDIIRQAAFLERSRHPAMEYVLELGDRPVTTRCDRRQIGQVLTNLLKNASESIEARLARDGDDRPGRIVVRLAAVPEGEGQQATVSVEDNGIGLPRENRERLTEPYVTTREKGTGLGLAIVRKIMEDHRGELRLGDAEGGGARIELVFHPLPADEAAADSNDTARAMAVATGIVAHGS